MNDGNSRAAKRVIEDCPISLDIDRLMTLGILTPGFASSRTLHWTDSGNTIFSAHFEAQVVHPKLSWVELRFSIIDAASGKRHEVVQTVAIARTYPGFGRVRYWFVDDGRRVGTLYLPQGSHEFRSRHVHRLAYASQRRTRVERRKRLEAKIRGRLGADPNSMGIPPKPSRMRWRTYHGMVRRLRRAQLCTSRPFEFSE